MERPVLILLMAYFAIAAVNVSADIVSRMKILNKPIIKFSWNEFLQKSDDVTPVQVTIAERTPPGFLKVTKSRGKLKISFDKYLPPT